MHLSIKKKWIPDTQKTIIVFFIIDISGSCLILPREQRLLRIRCRSKHGFYSRRDSHQNILRTFFSCPLPQILIPQTTPCTLHGIFVRLTHSYYCINQDYLKPSTKVGRCFPYIWILPFYSLLEIY